MPPALAAGAVAAATAAAETARFEAERRRQQEELAAAQAEIERTRQLAASERARFLQERQEAQAELERVRREAEKLPIAAAQAGDELRSLQAELAKRPEGARLLPASGSADAVVAADSGATPEVPYDERRARLEEEEFKLRERLKTAERAEERIRGLDAELRKRKASVDDSSNGLGQREAALEGREAKMAKRSQDVERQEHEVAKRQNELKTWQNVLNSRGAALQTREDELERKRQQLERDIDAMDARNSQPSMRQPAVPSMNPPASTAPASPRASPFGQDQRRRRLDRQRSRSSYRSSVSDNAASRYGGEQSDSDSGNLEGHDDGSMDPFHMFGEKASGASRPVPAKAAIASATPKGSMPPPPPPPSGQKLRTPPPAPRPPPPPPAPRGP